MLGTVGSSDTRMTIRPVCFRKPLHGRSQLFPCVDTHAWSFVVLDQRLQYLVGWYTNRILTKLHHLHKTCCLYSVRKTSHQVVCRLDVPDSPVEVNCWNSVEDTFVQWQLSVPGQLDTKVRKSATSVLHCVIRCRAEQSRGCLNRCSEQVQSHKGGGGESWCSLLSTAS